MIERNFDIAFIADLALREKQIQQNYRPIIAVHKWFARRPGTLFRGLILSEFGPPSLEESFFQSHSFNDKWIADPLMGGGTPLIEANRLGCNIIGYDINPMAYWIVRQEIEHLDLNAYKAATIKLAHQIEHQIGDLYRTRCCKCGLLDASVKYFLWVKTQSCMHCGKDIDLFPGYLVADDTRHTANVLVCASCGMFSETPDRKKPGDCQWCGVSLSLVGPASRSHCNCPHCGKGNIYPTPASGPPRHRMFAIEYYCAHCKAQHQGRFFKSPDRDDLIKYANAASRWEDAQPRFVPEDEIPSGDETDRLHRWGYKYYRDMFNSRQLLGLELICQTLFDEPDERVRNALATNLSDLLRYQNMLCRYDTMALKSMDIFSVHGFPVGLIQCESNLIGILTKDGINVGSGGWLNIVEKYAKAKAYCDHPFEVRVQGGRKTTVYFPGEWIGDARNGSKPFSQRQVQLHCQSATKAAIAESTLDAVFTDPPYFGNVQYAELMDFCYVWLRRLVGTEHTAFAAKSTRNQAELTGNVTMERGLDHFTAGLSTVFQRMAYALKPGAPLVFTYHHNTLEAYHPLAVAILDAGLRCSASLPCPAEMRASIHISGTQSSVVDTVLVCRANGRVPRRWIVETPEAIAALVREDCDQLRAGGVKLTQGDIRCIIYGHLIRLAIWRLCATWDGTRPVLEKLASVRSELQALGNLDNIEKCVASTASQEIFVQGPLFALKEAHPRYEVATDDISF